MNRNLSDTKNVGLRHLIEFRILVSRRHTVKTLMRTVELSAETKALLDQAMMRFRVNNPDVVLQTALKVWLEKVAQEKNGGEQSDN
jgi:hypothetical protein